MADITITPANVVKGSPSTIDSASVAGESITQGQYLYKKSSDGKWWKAQCDGTDEEAGVGVDTGVALNAASANQPLSVLRSGQITIGGTVVVGMVYVLSATAAGICPLADLVSTNKVHIVGYGLTAAILVVDPTATGVAKP